MTHRQIDVDQYDEDRYIEAEEHDAGLSSALSERQSKVKQMLSGGQTDEALKTAIADPLYKADQSLKVCGGGGGGALHIIKDKIKILTNVCLCTWVVIRMKVLNSLTKSLLHSRRLTFRNLCPL